MKIQKLHKKVFAWLLIACMVSGFIPSKTLAAPDTGTNATYTNAGIIFNYASQMREVNTKTDYSVGGFSWDTENKPDSWRYFNGLMLDALLMLGGEQNRSYADAFYNDNIAEGGAIEQYAIGELDAAESARGLFDLLDSQHAEKYKQAIQYVYTQIEDQTSYDACGGNLLHKQDASGNPTSGWQTWNIGLDGLYMVQPFLMECANAIESGKLTLKDQNGAAVSPEDIYTTVTDRFTWIYDAMYDNSTGLYNHGYNVAESKVNGHFWGRAVGWYAMALTDVIDMMPEGNRKQTLTGYLPRLFDGMMKYQDAETGMWYNVVNRGTDLNKNILETSSSSMMAYALMKAYNNGWVTDVKYGRAGLAAFNGVVENKVTGSEGSYAVQDTYLKSGVGATDDAYCVYSYTVNEAKGVGALIMAAAQAEGTADKVAGTTEEKPDIPVTDNTGFASGTLSGGTVTKYVLDTDGIDRGETYLIVSSNSGTAYALRNNNGSTGKQAVTINGNVAEITQNQTSSEWTVGTSKTTFKNGSRYIRLSSSILGSDSRTMNVVSEGNGAYTIKYSKYYLSYSSGQWTRRTGESSVYLYKKETTQVPGETVVLTVQPSVAALKQGETFDLTATVQAGELEVTSSDIIWKSDAEAVVTVDENGQLTGVSNGTAVITVTLNSVNGRNLTEPVSVQIPVTVEGNPYGGLEDAVVYPEYPEDGAVRTDKTATGVNFGSTGVSKVELTAAGISEKQGVDVVLVVDISNSMAWSLENSGNATDSVRLPDEGQSTKFENVMTSAKSFASILLGDQTGGTSDNTLSFVTFAGYDVQHSSYDSDDQYEDSVMTVFSGVSDYAAAEKSFNGTSVTGVPNGTGASYTIKVADETGRELVNGPNRGNTNYDYAFYQAQSAVSDIQGNDYAGSGRQTYVIFMTDGAPSHYNKNNCNGSSGRDRFPDSTRNTYQLRYNTGNWTSYIQETKNVYAGELYNMVDGNFYAIGFDLANGGFSDYKADEATLTSVLTNMAEGGKIPVMTANSVEEIRKFYEAIATKIKYAGTSARVTDTIGSSFTLQTQTFGGNGTPENPADIQVTAYDLYTKAETAEADLIGTRKGTSTVIENVTFNPEGTEAYSNQLTGNIMTTDAEGTVTIAARYFTYTKTAAGVEQFVWNIGDITDKEIALSYYAYLKGSLEGTCKKGMYATNEEAKLEYVDVNGCYAVQTYPVPKVNWGGASTTYEYYLVNEKGEPVNHAGQVIPFANRIILWGDTIALNLNQDMTIPAQTISAAEHLPEGYFLYDKDASYTVQTSSGVQQDPGIIVSEPSEDAYKTTGEGAAQITQNGAQTTKVVSYEEIYYTQSRVAFGVRWDLTPSYAEHPLEKDQTVIDYGKAVQIDVAANDVSVQEGYGVEPVGFAAYDANAKLTQYVLTPGSSEYRSENGVYTIVDGKVNFQLSRMLSQIEKVFCVMKVSNKENAENFYYLYEELDIIPATSVYYETDFAQNVFRFNDDAKWQPVHVEGTEPKDNLQEVSVRGADLYGYDSSYENDAGYSDYESYAVTGEGSQTTTANFEFTGTGFDLISSTGAQEGFIRVSVYSDADKTTLEKRVTVLNKSESNLTLYQIPVVSIENLAYGTYYVEIGVSAPVTGAPVEALNNGGCFHFDAVRVMNPLNADDMGDDKAAYDAYVEDGEAHAEITEVRNLLLAANTFDTAGEEPAPGVVFVDRVTNEETGTHDAVIADYKTIGPNNEVYLTASEAGSQKIGFKLRKSDIMPESIDLGAKSADGKPVQLIVSAYPVLADGTIAKDRIYKTVKDISTCTAQYYDLFAGQENNIAEAFGTGDTIYISVENGNKDGNILSITDLKTAYGAQSGTIEIFSDKNSIERTKQFAARPVTDVPEESGRQPHTGVEKVDWFYKSVYYSYLRKVVTRLWADESGAGENKADESGADKSTAGENSAKVQTVVTPHERMEGEDKTDYRNIVIECAEMIQRFAERQTADVQFKRGGK